MWGYVPLPFQGGSDRQSPTSQPAWVGTGISSKGWGGFDPGLPGQHDPGGGWTAGEWTEKPTAPQTWKWPPLKAKVGAPPSALFNLNAPFSRRSSRPTPLLKVFSSPGSLNWNGRKPLDCQTPLTLGVWLNRNYLALNLQTIFHTPFPPQVREGGGGLFKSSFWGSQSPRVCPQQCPGMRGETRDMGGRGR